MEQLQSRRSHNEAAESSRDFVMGSHSWQTAQTDAVHLPRSFARGHCARADPFLVGNASTRCDGLTLAGPIGLTVRSEKTRVARFCAGKL